MFSLPVMEIMHTVNECKAKVKLENVDLSDIDTRNSLVLKTPTTTLPFLETNKGNISQSTAIENYLCLKYKPELLGNSEFEKAQVNQWIEFASCEINRCFKSIIYPIFGWAPYCKENADKDNSILKDYLKIIENNLKKNSYIVGEKLTLADILLFRHLRLFMMFHFPEGLRKSLLPHITKWFEKIMKSNEAMRAYGRTLLCKIPLKPFSGKINRNIEILDNKDEDENMERHGKKGKKNKKELKVNQGADAVKKEKENYVPGLLELPRFNIKEKENNPLDALPESKFDLEKFKKNF